MDRSGKNMQWKWGRPENIQTVTFINPKTPEKVAVSFKTCLINHSKLVFIKSKLVPNTIFLVIYIRKAYI